jgi:hypothetical protein
MLTGKTHIFAIMDSAGRLATLRLRVWRGVREQTRHQTIPPGLLICNKLFLLRCYVSEGRNGVIEGDKLCDFTFSGPDRDLRGCYLSKVYKGSTTGEGKDEDSLGVIVVVPNRPVCTN